MNANAPVTPARPRTVPTHTPIVQPRPLSQRTPPTYSPLDRMTRSYVNSMPTLHPTRRSPAPHINADAEALERRKAKEKASEENEKKDEMLEDSLKTRIFGWAVMESCERRYWKAKERGDFDE
jgi:hypothetical protein